MQAMEISRSALDVEWRRLEIIAQNLASADGANKVGGTAYHAQRLVSGPKADFATHLTREQVAAAPTDLQSLAGIAILGVENDSTPPRLVHEPGNPNANAAGFVAYPAIDHAEQMTLMVKTARIYEANIVAMNTARQMYSKALELGKRG